MNAGEKNNPKNRKEEETEEKRGGNKERKKKERRKERKLSGEIVFQRFNAVGSYRTTVSVSEARAETETRN